MKRGAQEKEKRKTYDAQLMYITNTEFNDFAVNHFGVSLSTNFANFCKSKLVWLGGHGFWFHNKMNDEMFARLLICRMPLLK